MKTLLRTDTTIELQCIFGSAGGCTVIYVGQWRIVVIDGVSTLYIKGCQISRKGSNTEKVGNPMWFSEDNLRIVTTYTNSVAEVTKA